MSHAQLVVVAVFSALAAMSVGSFVGVIIDRMPYPLAEPDEFGDMWGTRPWSEVLGGDSRCSTCGEGITWKDNIPVVGWLRLRGRCRGCHENIPRSLLFVEILVPAVGAFLVWKLGLHWDLLPALWLVPVAVAVSGIDIRAFIVPTKIVWPAFGVSIMLAGIASLLDGHPSYLLGGLVGIACLSGPLFVIWFIHPKGMGFGDVRLTVLLGWTVGYINASDRLITSVFMAVFCLSVAAILGLAFSIAGLSARGRKARVPFGPPLALAAMICLGYAAPILRFFDLVK